MQLQFNPVPAREESPHCPKSNDTTPRIVPEFQSRSNGTGSSFLVYAIAYQIFIEGEYSYIVTVTVADNQNCQHPRNSTLLNGLLKI